RPRPGSCCSSTCSHAPRLARSRGTNRADAPDPTNDPDPMTAAGALERRDHPMPIHETREHPQGSAADPVGLDRVTFDHVAIAVRHPTDPWPIFADVLGGRYLDRGVNPGFGWTQLRFANGFVLEGLNPEPSDRDDFLNRFLDRNGPGPHHLTFKVPD